MSSVFASTHCLRGPSNIISSTFNCRSKSGCTLAVTKHCCRCDTRLLSSTILPWRSREREQGWRLDKYSHFHRGRKHRGCIFLVAPVAATGSPENGKSGKSTWDISRFANTVFFFNSPPSFNEVVSMLAAPTKLIKAVTSIFQPRDMAAGGAGAGGRKEELVMVVGGTGGVGRRVVHALKKRGIPVRALVRDREKGEKLLGSNIELVLADLTQRQTLLPEYFEGVSRVVSCFACIVGPKEGDTPNRDKYMQGIKFYVPEIKGDTPEAVEYLGMKNLLDVVSPRLGLRQGLPLLAISEKGIPSGPAWGALDDVVMGGVSKSGFQIDMTGGEHGKPVALFKGYVSTDNNGGFASIRCKNFDPVVDLSAYEGLMVRLKGNGKRFKFVIRTDSDWDSVSYPQSFDTQPGVWQTVYLPFSGFQTVFRAKSLPNGPPLNTSRVSSVQIVYSKFEYDGALNPAFEKGPFELPVESIKAYLKQPVTSRFVHVSSAGVTRPGRPGLDLEKQPPAVRLNDELGGLLTYKLKGEDVIRDSGVPFSIIRPVALTEEPAGAELAVAQGDDITGKISREDVANLCMACLFDTAAVDKTFEVKSLVPFSTPFTVDPSNPLPERDFGPLLSTLVEGVTGKLEEEKAAMSA